MRIEGLILFALSCECVAQDLFKEQLRLRNLKDGSVFVIFDFQMESTLTVANSYNLFPRSIGELVRKYEISKLFLSFTSNHWNNFKHGITANNPTGLLSYASFRGNESVVDENWKHTTNVLAGIFCASILQLGNTSTSTPKISLDLPNLRYGLLPRENVCTENLSPWIKLLPCKSKMGIASLLNSYKLFDSSYTTLTVDVKTTCIDKECLTQKAILELSVSVLFDLSRREIGNSLSLHSLFDRQISSKCLLSSSSKILVESNKNVILKPASKKVCRDKLQGDISDPEYVCYDLKNNEVFTLDWTYPNGIISDNTPHLFTVGRYFVGYGEERGGLEIVINNQSDDDTEVIYFDMLPWYMRIYIHTLHIWVNNDVKDELIKKMFFQAAIDRKRPNVIELQIVVPSKTSLVIRMDFEKTLLRYTEYPPDANRGFDVPPAMITIMDPTHLYLNISSKGKAKPLRMFTQALLLTLPTPDFSMPYNVITLTSTVIALYFGSVYNSLVRSFTPVKKGVPKSSLGKLIWRIKNAITILKEKIQKIIRLVSRRK